MSNGHGGARIGAGKKRKPLTEKLLEGNPGHRKLTVVEFGGVPDLVGADMPRPREFLSELQKDGAQLLAAEIYESTWNWLSERGCARLISSEALELYAVSVSRWIQCERAVSAHGFLAKHPTTGNAIPSPYVAMSQSYAKQANNVWYQIFQTVRENCATEFKGNPHEDVMERLLTGKKGGL